MAGPLGSAGGRSSLPEFGSSASHLGRPDVGLMSLPEMVDNARRIAQAIDIPLVADADTGYGNSINVIRAVREYEAAGVAARRSPEFRIIARTDARAVEGLESALDRARVYVEAGADVLFVEAPQSEAEIETVAATQAMRAALARVTADGTPIELLPSLPGFDEFLDFIGLPEVRELEQRFAEE